jgi:hypothetical protein
MKVHCARNVRAASVKVPHRFACVSSTTALARRNPYAILSISAAHVHIARVIHFVGALTKVGPNNEQNDEVGKVVSQITCRLPTRTDTGRASGPEYAEGDRYRDRRESADRMGAIHAQAKGEHSLSSGHGSITSAVATRTCPEAHTKRLSLVTFFAAAKKVTPPPGRRLLQ